ncbi:bacteriohemerythrin [Marichromatium gracile]|uniref:Hemerythrin n=1 Tax=Marichromatium gracile TaxID=1048 RepID=A0A4R4AJY5_MARGR|nr:hemerythrin family protein [Marichromatium gracile]MBK1707728.1 hemerythrin [Marichromatium gracile]TCW39718.1 hemerythrin [Marichromatium gracile]
MSKLPRWREDWSLNIDVIDQEHRALIERLADLCLRFCPEATPTRSGEAHALIEALAELGEQARAHFQHEERFMRAIGFDELPEHQREHALMMAEYTALLREWRAEGVEVFTPAIQETVREWLLAHILGADREFARAYFQLCGGDDPVAPRPSRNLQLG